MIKQAPILAAGALGAVLVLTGCGASSAPGVPSSALATAPATAPDAAPSAAATPAAGPHGDADVSFASMMVPHHDQAIEMSDLLLTKSDVDPRVSALARQIKAAQGPQVAQMSGWLAGWGQDPSPSSMGGMSGMGAGDGLMSQADMDALKTATGDQAARLFLTGMIKHHEGAVTMARTELDAGQNPDAKALAADVVATQQAEIAQMNRLLGA